MLLPPHQPFLPYPPRADLWRVRSWKCASTSFRFSCAALVWLHETAWFSYTSVRSRTCLGALMGKHRACHSQTAMAQLRRSLAVLDEANVLGVCARGSVGLLVSCLAKQQSGCPCAKNRRPRMRRETASEHAPQDGAGGSSTTAVHLPPAEHPGSHSRKHWRQMFMPYLRMRPPWLEHTRQRREPLPYSLGCWFHTVSNGMVAGCCRVQSGGKRSRGRAISSRDAEQQRRVQRRRQRRAAEWRRVAAGRGALQAGRARSGRVRPTVLAGRGPVRMAMQATGAASHGSGCGAPAWLAARRQAR